MIRNVFLLWALIIHSFTNYGQNSTIEDIDEEKSSLNFIEPTLTINRPIKGFKERFGKKIVGFDLSYLRQLNPDKPLFLLSRFGYFSLGSNTVETQDDIQDKTSSHNIKLDLGIRYYLPLKFEFIEFFGEGHVGLNNMYAINSFSQDEETLDTEFLLGDTSMKYGASIGANIKIGYGYFLLKCGVENGISTNYLYENLEVFSQVFDKSIDAFKKTKSSIDIVKWDIGFTFVF